MYVCVCVAERVDGLYLYAMFAELTGVAGGRVAERVSVMVLGLVPLERWGLRGEGGCLWGWCWGCRSGEDVVDGGEMQGRG